MAIFESLPVSENCLDDSVPLFCNFLNSRIIDGHTEYIIEVQRGFNKINSWKIFKRYREFYELHKELHASNFNIHLPQKKFFGNLDRQFIIERKHRLQIYMNKVLENPILSSTFCIKKFLDPKNYNNSFQESAFQYASMALRGKPDFHNIKTLSNIGWRFRKHYFSIKRLNEAKKEYILTWISDHNFKKCLNEKELQSTFKIFCELSHPYITQIISGNCYNTSALIIRSCCTKGSLRDLIYEKSPFDKFLNKFRYQREHERLILQLSEIKTISVQVLHALKFLHEKRIPYGNLHSGNIFIEDNVAKISDIENSIFGLPSFYKSYFIENRRIRTIEDIDVYCFGHVLYEMALGERLDSTYCDVISTDCYEEIRPVLQLILSNTPKQQLPSVSQISVLDTFKFYYSNVIYEFNPRCKISATNLQLFQKCVENIEGNIHREQNELRKYRKISKLEELIDTEETVDSVSRKKEKNKLKKITSQSSLATHNSDQLESISNASSTLTSVSIDSNIPNTSLDKVNEKQCNIEKVNSSISPTDDRTAFLQSIISFNKNNLKKVNDTK